MAIKRRPVKACLPAGTAHGGKRSKKATKAKKAGKKVVSRKQKVESRLLKEKLLGKVDHFFDKISVATMELKFPIKVSDIIHVKGHTTDFVQRIDSMQIEHEDVKKASRGQGVGFRVIEKVRDGDSVFLAADQKSIPVKATPVVQRSILPNKEKAVQFKPSITAKPVVSKLQVVQSSMFPTIASKPQPPMVAKPTTPSFNVSKPVAKPQQNLSPQIPKPEPKKKADPYSNTKFLSF